MNPAAKFRDYDARARARIIAATTGRPGRLGLVWRILVRVVVFLGRRVWGFTRVCGTWAVKNPGWPVVGLVLAFLWHGALVLAEWPGDRTTGPLVLLVASMTPGLFLGAWAAVFPWHHARTTNKWAIRRSWIKTARACGLYRLDTGSPVRGTFWGTARTVGSTVTVSRLRKVRHERGSVTLRIQTFRGQTLDSIRRAAPALATAYSAYGFDTVQVSPRLLDLILFTTDRLPARNAGLPNPDKITTNAVPVGRTRSGKECTLTVQGRHTFVVGASGSGKGSVLWSVVGGLAPAVHAGLVQLWGVDLKKGLEIETGRALFGQVAYTATDAVTVLRALLAVIDERGAAMRGVSRQHTPAVGDPLHVLLVDELSDLMAYSDLDTRREAERLMSKILTQGRALGVVVVSCGQNPRQEAVGGTRSLYTQRIALRLDSETETVMVLEGLAPLGPAHTINRNDPGTGYLVTEEGTPVLVRFDYWSDDLIRTMARHYAAPAYQTLDHTGPAAPDAPRSGMDAAQAWAAAGGRLAVVANPDDTPAGDTSNDVSEDNPAPRQRKPRSPRKPRAPRAPRATGPATAAAPEED